MPTKNHTAGTDRHLIEQIVSELQSMLKYADATQKNEIQTYIDEFRSMIKYAA